MSSDDWVRKKLEAGEYGERLKERWEKIQKEAADQPLLDQPWVRPFREGMIIGFIFGLVVGLLVAIGAAWAFT